MVPINWYVVKRQLTASQALMATPDKSAQWRNNTMKLHPYLTYGGNCAEAFRFYEQHLGGKITAIMAWGDMPDPKHVPPGYEKAVLHARMNIGENLRAD